MNSERMWSILLFLSPLLAGGMIRWLKPSIALSCSTRFDNWVSVQRKKVASKQGIISTYIISPVLATLAKLSEWTGQIQNEYGRCGAQATLYLYFAAALVALAYAAFLVVIFVLGLLMLWGILWVLNELFGDQNERIKQTPTRSAMPFFDESHSEEPDVMPLAVGKGDLYSGSNWLNETKVGSVDADGKIMKGSNWLTEEQVGKVDNDGNILQGTNWLNEKKVGKVDADGRIYEGSTWADEQQIGRIDEDGNVYEGTSWLNEKKVGRVDREKK